MIVYFKQINGRYEDPGKNEITQEMLDKYKHSIHGDTGWIDIPNSPEKVSDLNTIIRPYLTKNNPSKEEKIHILHQLGFVRLDETTWINEVFMSNHPIQFDLEKEILPQFIFRVFKAGLFTTSKIRNHAFKRNY